MKWLIASDIHGSAADFQQLMEAFRQEGSDRLLLLGDILAGGTPEGRREIADSLNAMADRITAAAGNCDYPEHRAMLHFDLENCAAIPGPGNRTVYATHGHLYNESSWPPRMQRGDILIHGHTHIPASAQYPSMLYFNPGSVARPFAGSSKSYMTWEGNVFLWKTLSGEEYRRYEV